MRRDELERLDRDALIARAEAVGVARASVLTRPELIDELLLRSEGGPRARGLFGRARDLVARIVERGLHLPDAAEKIRTTGLPHAIANTPASALPTVTLAEIYAAQGYRSRAIETLQNVLELEPDHEAARALLFELEHGDRVTEPLPRPEEEEEQPVQAASPDDATAPAPVHPPPRFDECVAFPIEGNGLFVYWQVQPATLARLAQAHAGGALVVRVLGIVPTWDGPRSMLVDRAVSDTTGDVTLEVPRGAVPRAAIGWRDGEVFVPIAHSPALESPAAARGADVIVRWTHQGEVPLRADDADAESIARARARADQTMSKG